MREASGVSFWVMTIINGNAGGGNQAEADAVVVCAYLGFIATRITLVQPILFTYDPNLDEWHGTTVGGNRNENWGENYKTMALLLQEALAQSGYDARPLGGIQVAPGPQHQGPGGPTEHTAITARWGGGLWTHEVWEDLGRGTYLDRNRRITDRQVESEVRQMLHGLQNSNEYGAYYGVVDDPITHQGGFVASSVRRIIPFNDEGRRWNAQIMFQGLIGRDRDSAMGEIGGGGGGGLDRTAAVGRSRAQAGSFESPYLIHDWFEGHDGGGGVMGYCHGMTWAIQKARQIGPWATPYEVATGRNTKKLASCMGCTLFMYATGYPPSAMHLGSADSWVPLPENQTQNPTLDDTTRVLNNLWARDVASHLLLGARIMRANGHFTPAARNAAAQLEQAVTARIGGHTNAEYKHAANIFLDALTMHKNDTKRIISTLAAAQI